MKDKLVEKVARAIAESDRNKESGIQMSDLWDSPSYRAIVTKHARAVIPVVLEEVQRHLSAVQYDPAPYTALKHRLRNLGSI